ncbi:polyamine-transporting ATPase 13A3 isoform X2 [Patella vulgata]|uniref:polyamine-transporting ATPase 13A3 isoform X2 n=1 Tax=Patella vulgata TaxID=6465 RepID=UPI0021809A18|nr:polyamine-transporting ATPase 13A3 isoform X2 [Patella vulgata]
MHSLDNPDEMDAELKIGTSGPPPMDPDKYYVNAGEEDQMEITGYKLNRLKQIITWFFIILTLGLLKLFFYWLPHIFLQCTHDKCTLSEAQAVLLTNYYAQYFVSTVETATRDGTRVRLLPTKTKYLYKKGQSQPVITYQESLKDENLMHYFISMKVKYIWDGERNEFIKLRGLESGSTCAYLHRCNGLSLNDQIKRRVLYGLNSIAVHVTPICVLLFKQVLSPFYIFQAFSMCVWYADEYYIYATCIIVISVFSIVVTIYQIRKMQRALRNTISSSTIVTVCRGNDVYVDVPSEDLVPGDIIEIPRHGCMMQCDTVLLSGNCIVNESMLTGESVPVTKTPLPNPLQLPGQPELLFDMKTHSRHVLFCGTQIIQTRYYGCKKVRAIVLRTGFITAKGELVRAILYPKPVDFKFNRDTYKFIGILAFIALMGFVYTLTLMIIDGDEVGEIILRCLDLVTITVPPALPAALAVGVVFAQMRLKKSSIFCISPNCINISGAVNAVCFDKTGTLTEDGLEMRGVIPVRKQRFEPEIQNMKELERGGLLNAMATCHSLTIIDGTIMGDPLDLIMFHSIDWKLEEPGQEESRFDMMVPTIVKPRTSPFLVGSTEQLQGEDIGVVRQFPFSSSLQRMSVIVRSLSGSNFELYAKGSPEMIASLSLPETVPENFHEILTEYTQHGYRVIAVACKQLPSKLNYVKVQRIGRDLVETELTFLGLLIMENKIKPETAPVIANLRNALIRTIMVTGDNMLTALSVAQECGMVDQGDRIILVQAYPPVDLKAPEIDFVYAGDSTKKVVEVKSQKGTMIEIDEENQRFHFALTGKSWSALRQYFPDIIQKILVRGAVFARMAPEQKAQLVEGLQNLGYYVAMCGDGANDCGALKTAHTGISLSEAEASVASPFTSKKPTIECVPKVISEGRCALVTSFGIFKYMALYSLTQFVSVLILYWNGANLTDAEFLYIDLFLITTLSVTFGYTAPYGQLVKDLPPSSLVSPGPILSLISQAAIQIIFQLFSYLYVATQPWFKEFEENDDYDYASHENTAVFLVSSYQYVALAVAFAKGAPFRKTIFSNYLFLMNLLICFAVSLWLTIYPTDYFAGVMELSPFPEITFRLIFVGIGVANFAVSLLLEMFLIDNVLIVRKCKGSCTCCKASDYDYTVIEKEIEDDPTWPPLDPSGQGLAQYLQRLESMNQMPPKDGNGKPSSATLEELLESTDDGTNQINQRVQNKEDSNVAVGNNDNFITSL